VEPKKTAAWAVLISEHDGTADFLGERGGGVAVYGSRVRAERVASFLRDALGDDVRNVRVARYRGKRRRRRNRRRA
jgi:hypothetical protein